MLRPENVPIYEEMKKTLEDNGKCLLVTHPGRGKSYITEEYLVSSQAGSVICVCPTNTICKQWKDDHYAVPMRICTYTAFSKYDEAQIGHPDIVIIDEAHHMGARIWGRNLVYVIENLVPLGTKVIALTADPTRWNDGKVNVADTWFDGCTVVGPSISESMEQGFINPFTYVISLYQPKWLVDKLLANKNANSAQLKSARTLAGRMQYLPENVKHVSKALQTYAPKTHQKGIVFCSRISDIPDAMDTLAKAYPNHPQYVIHNKQSAKMNRTSMDDFNAANDAFLFSINMATEGIHTKGVNMVVMFRKTESPNLYAQMMGRIIDPNIKDAYLHDIVGNNTSIERVLKRTEGTAAEISRIIPIMQNGTASKPKQIIVKDLAAPALDIIKQIDAVMKTCMLTDDDKQFIRDNCQTMGIKDIATVLNVPMNKVNDLIMEEDLRTKPMPPWTPLREKALLMMVDEGKDDHYIAMVMDLKDHEVAWKRTELSQKGGA